MIKSLLVSQQWTLIIRHNYAFMNLFERKRNKHIPLSREMQGNTSCIAYRFFLGGIMIPFSRWRCIEAESDNAGRHIASGVGVAGIGVGVGSFTATCHRYGTSRVMTANQKSRCQPTPNGNYCKVASSVADEGWNMSRMMYRDGKKMVFRNVEWEMPSTVRGMCTRRKILGEK